MSLAIWQVGLVIRENIELIGISNGAFSCELGSYMLFHLWQIMLLNWLMCHRLHTVLNDVAHTHDLWKAAIPQYDPVFLSGLYHRQANLNNPDKSCGCYLIPNRLISEKGATLVTNYFWNLITLTYLWYKKKPNEQIQDLDLKLCLVLTQH